MAGRTDALEYGGIGVDVGDLYGLTLQIGALVGFVLLWWVGALLTPSTLVPEPPAVAAVLVGDVVDGSVFGLIGRSLEHYIPGLVVGSALGIAVGIGVGWSFALDRTVGTVASVLRPVPPLAWIPFAIIWFSLSNAAAAFIIAIVAFWINYYAAESGVRSVDDKLIEVARSLGTDSDLRLVRKVVIPSALPELFTGFRTAAGQAWMVMVAAELLGVPGLGKHLWDAANFLRMNVVIAYMLVIGVLFLLSDTLVRAVQREVLAWR